VVAADELGGLPCLGLPIAPPLAFALLIVGGADGDPAEVAELAAELEALGFSALWVPDVGGDVLGALDRLLGATSSVVIATGILNIWMHSAAEVGEWRAALGDADRDRLLLGIGISHAPLIDAQPGMSWERPLATTRAYLDAMDAAGIPLEARCVAALGPKMLELARDRSAGAHPYLVTPEHTAMARDALGAGALLAVEQGAVLETDGDVARDIARQALGVYATLPNYVNNWKRLGFTDEDAASLSDRLVDALVAWGDPDTVAERVQAHRDAGADHVCVQLLAPPRARVPLDDWRRLAPAVV
jgi:probable F420-dependent oxidoreductase